MPFRSVPPAASGAGPTGPVQDVHRSRVVCIRVVPAEPARMYVTYRGERSYVTQCRDTGRISDVLAAAAELGARAGLVAELEGVTWWAPV